MYQKIPQHVIKEFPPPTHTHTLSDCFSYLLQSISAHLSDFPLLWCHINEKCETQASTFKCFGQVGIDPPEELDFVVTK